MKMWLLYTGWILQLADINLHNYACKNKRENTRHLQPDFNYTVPDQRFLNRVQEM